MNGLKLIRNICNYSQKDLAEKIGVSRQAINMWENARKVIPDKRKKELCRFFGISDMEWLGEIDEETRLVICTQPMYKSVDDKSEHYFFSHTDNVSETNSRSLPLSPPISLDDKCLLKREELKELMDDILRFNDDITVKNSYDALARTNRTIKALTGWHDAMKAAMEQEPHMKMPYYFVICAVMDALNMSFGSITGDDVISSVPEIYSKDERYDHSSFSMDVAKIITEHIDRVRSLFALT